MSNSCVETPAAPEWLSKLEDRREKLKQSKLGHEAGAGAPCNECGDKCPGLDLHFWRKVCRNCKCRKDQHKCPDDDFSGWAQFEILGQIRSKPAYIKINALASLPVQVEWVPPNVALDVVSDYMDKLGTANVPVAGSEAAAKRKQQLEFQVPPHDLDASLCDNLSESEANQLQQYVQKIRDNCVGQGSVVRVGNFGNAIVGDAGEWSGGDNQQRNTTRYTEVMRALQVQEAPVADTILTELLSNEKLAKAICNESPSAYEKIFVAFSEPISETPFNCAAGCELSLATQQKLRGLNKAAIESVTQQGPIYDKLFVVLKKNNLDISRDPVLGPIADFRREYISNPVLRKEVDAICHGERSGHLTSPPNTPLAASKELLFNSPLPLKQAAQYRTGSKMVQETPVRKVKFGETSTVVYDCGLPASIDYERDAIFARIINSEALKSALLNARHGKMAERIVISSTSTPPDYMDEPLLRDNTKEDLKSIQVNSTAMMQSSVLNAPFYERLFKTLHDKNINYNDCKLLKPLQLLFNELCTNRPFYEEVREYVASLPSSSAITYSPLMANARGTLSCSKSTDSGFESKPSTPSHTHSSFGGPINNEELSASSGRFATIPGIQEMNMYPPVEPPGPAGALSDAFKNSLSLNNSPPFKQPLSSSPFKCRDCEKIIGFGEVVVKAERAGREIAWHPECFKCHTCRELLADLVYFFHGGQVYCGRDLAVKLRIPRCKACDELIFTKEYTAAEGATFHIKHFCCYHCDRPLAGQQYVPDEKTNMPLCLKCYDEYFAAACQRCQRPIGPADQGVAWGEVHWHGSCFVCAGLHCGKSLIGSRFCVKQKMPFCSSACVRSIVG